MATTDDLKHLPLEGLHREAGARFGSFAGWSMPLTYPAGVMKEHLHCRSAAGLFDISHMKLFGISGRDAAALLSKACPIDAGAMPVGQSKYTFFLNDDAGILDDLIVTRTAEARYVVVANAGNAQADETHLRGLARNFNGDVEALDRVFLALQGPAAARVAEAVGLGAGHLSFMQAFEPETGWFVSRSGYTGEDGFEIALPPAQAEAFARRLLAQPDVEWIGLAARDSLRLEAGLCLHGQDIAPDTTPVEAGLLWAIAKPLRNGGRFVGAAALAAAVAAGPGRKRVGLKPEGRQPVRAGSPIVDAAGRPIGMVTSGGFGPSVEGPVAMGYVETGMLDAPLFAEVRGQSPARFALPSPLPPPPHAQRMSRMAKLYFTDDHEWIAVDGDSATVGITNYAQEQLGDLVFVELPETGRTIARGDTVVVVESVKAASDVYAPIAGEITAVNEALASEPGLVNSSAQSTGWLWKMTIDDQSQLDGLMDETAYGEKTA